MKKSTINIIKNAKIPLIKTLKFKFKNIPKRKKIIMGKNI
jgi:hypothetical protein